MCFELVFSLTNHLFFFSVQIHFADEFVVFDLFHFQEYYCNEFTVKFVAYEKFKDRPLNFYF